jgi:hypothetical protein
LRQQLRRLALQVAYAHGLLRIGPMEYRTAVRQKLCQRVGSAIGIFLCGLLREKCHDREEREGVR